MSKRTPLLLIADIIDSGQKILTYTGQCPNDSGKAANIFWTIKFLSFTFRGQFGLQPLPTYHLANLPTDKLLPYSPAITAVKYSLFILAI